MVAAQNLIKKTALLLVTALVVTVPGRSQSQLSATPNPVALTGTSTIVQVATSGSGPYTIAKNGAFFQTSATTGSAPDSFFVQLTNTSCSNGNVVCNGSITLHPTSATGGGTDVTVPVTFTPGSGTGGGTNGVISANPSSVTLNAFTGQSVSTSVGLTTSSTTPIGFSLSTTPTNGTSWLSVQASNFQVSAGGTSPGPVTLTVFANATNIFSTQTGSITITPTNGGAATVISVTLTIGSNGSSTYSVSPTSVSLNYPNGPTSQQVVIFSNNSSVTTFNVQVTNCPSGTFLLANGGTSLSNQSVAGALTLTLNNPQNFGTGSYSCSAIVSNPSNSSDQVTIPVTLSVNGGGSNGIYTLTPSTLNFVSAINSTDPKTASVNVASNSATQYNATFTSNSSPNGSTNWVTLNASGQTTVSGQPVANGMNVSLNNPSSFAAGSYSGTITVSNPAGSGTNSTLSVFLTVNSSGTGGNSYTVNVSTVSLQYPTGSSASNVTIFSNTQSTFQATATTNSGNNWLLVAQGTSNFGTSIIGTTGSSGGTLTVYLNTNAIPPAGTYTGQVKVSNPSNANDFVTINVTLNQNNSGGGSSFVSPSALNFSTPVGVIPSQQAVAVTVPSGTVFGASIQAPLGSNFITSPCNGCTYTGSQSLQVAINPGSLPSGTYTNYINLTQNGSTFATVTVTLTVGSGSGGGNTGTIAAPTALTFSYQPNQSSFPPQQTVSIGASGTFNASSTQSWLIVSPASGTGPGYLTVSVIPQGFSAGSSNQGVINISTPSGNQSITVNLNVTSGSVLYANPSTINFSYSAGSAAYQTVFQITASDNSTQALSVTSGASWITIGSPTNSGNTPVSYIVTANPAGLCNGLNTGNITVTSSSASNSPLTIPVTALVSGSTSTTCSSSSGPLTITPSSLTFTGAVNGSAPSTQNLSITTPASNTQFTVSTSIQSGSTNWLNVSFPCNNCTLTGGQNLTIAVNQASLSAGTYQGTILFNANGGSQSVPVTLTVGASGGSGNLTVSPTSLSFTAQVNGSAPTPQTVSVSGPSGSSGVGYTYTVSTSSGGSWLSASTNAGAVSNGQSLLTPTNLLVAANPSGLSAGTYSGTITLSPNGGTVVSISVTLTVANNSVTASPGSLTFTFNAGSSAPSAQTVTVTSGTPGLPFAVQATSGGCGSSNWLSVSPAAGTTPGNVSVSINTGSLTAGTCSGSITVTGTGGATGTTTISVSLTVTAPLPTITQVSSAASYIGQSISPGEVITIFGTSIGPTPLVSLVLDSSGKVASSLGGVQVLVGGIACPMIYASNTQVAAVAPYEIALLRQTNVIVKFLGQTSNAIAVNVSPTTTGIFTSNASGTGPGAISNQNGSINSPTNPANKGDTVAIYLTGEGQTSPAGVNGLVTTGTLPAPQVSPAPLLPVAVLIDGQPAAVKYAGEAPGIVSGVMQLNVQIPAGARSGDLSLVVTIGGTSSQNGVTISVR